MSRAGVIRHPDGASALARPDALAPVRVIRATIGHLDADLVPVAVVVLLATRTLIRAATGRLFDALRFSVLHGQGALATEPVRPAVAVRQRVDAVEGHARLPTGQVEIGRRDVPRAGGAQPELADQRRQRTAGQTANDVPTRRSRHDDLRPSIKSTPVHVPSSRLGPERCRAAPDAAIPLNPFAKSERSMRSTCFGRAARPRAKPIRQSCHGGSVNGQR